jgi:hypothetical protein
LFPQICFILYPVSPLLKKNISRTFVPDKDSLNRRSHFHLLFDCVLLSKRTVEACPSSGYSQFFRQVAKVIAAPHAFDGHPLKFP